jgi:hypothetical protein
MGRLCIRRRSNNCCRDYIHSVFDGGTCSDAVHCRTCRKRSLGAATPRIKTIEMQKTPNQLPDPTSPSVKPPASAGGAPSVAADHLDVRRGRTDTRKPMKSSLFARVGCFYLPCSVVGCVLYLLAAGFCATVFVAVDRHSHSVSDTLYGIYPFFVATFLLLDWIARRLREMPNRLPDPTSPSVTLPAGAGGVPTVAADH